jgi:hypothetical protein
MEFNLKRIVSYCVPVCVLIILCYSPSIASTDYCPTEGWRTSTPEKQGIDSGKLIEMMIKIEEMEAHFDSITIVRNGYLVTDAYFYPFEKGLKHVIHSCTKSITSA